VQALDPLEMLGESGLGHRREDVEAVLGKRVTSGALVSRAIVPAE
jgi:hypothetical protein